MLIYSLLRVFLFYITSATLALYIVKNRKILMPHSIVHFEIIGKNPSALQKFYKELFGWEVDTNVAVAPEVSQQGSYGFIMPTEKSEGIPGGIGGGTDYKSHAVFYVGVDNVADMLAKAEQLGGRRVMGPARRPDGGVVVAHFADLEGNLIGLAGPQ